MQQNINYQEAINLRDIGINALKQTLGEEQTKKFLGLFNYYEVSDISEELLARDYTEWRRTKSCYNDYNMAEICAYFKNNPEKSWHINEVGDKIYDV